MRLPALMQADERLIDLPMFLRERYAPARHIVGYLQVTHAAFELPEVIGD